MKRTRGAFASTVAVTMWVITVPLLTAQQAPVTRQVLEKIDLGDKEGIMYVAEFAPKASTGKHFHSGPETVYVLHGYGTLEMEGHPPVTFKAGESFSIPAKHVHEAKNASDSDQWKLVVFLSGEKGQPIVTPVTQPYFWKP
jgi:quercetin dioxygenase-like cupin family protein